MLACGLTSELTTACEVLRTKRKLFIFELNKIRNSTSFVSLRVPPRYLEMPLWYTYMNTYGTNCGATRNFPTFWQRLELLTEDMDQNTITGPVTPLLDWD